MGGAGHREPSVSIEDITEQEVGGLGKAGGPKGHTG
jgi:hypothetical protein